MSSERHRHRLAVAAGGLLLALVAACASDAAFRADAPTLPAQDVPALFALADSAAGSGSAAGACNSPLVDPRDGTTLRLVRSSGGRGDYEPPAGRYGVGAGQLLRVDCGSGRTIGIVSR